MYLKVHYVHVLSVLLISSVLNLWQQTIWELGGESSDTLVWLSCLDSFDLKVTLDDSSPDLYHTVSIDLNLNKGARVLGA